MKTNGIKLLLAGWLGAALPAMGQQTSWQWTARMGRPAMTGEIFAPANGTAAMATNDGGVVVGGYYEKYISLGTAPGDTLRGNAYGDAMLVKYSAAGQKQWAVTLGPPANPGNPNNDAGMAPVMEDSQRNIFCIAYHGTPLPLPTGVTLPGYGNAWLRYSPTGILLAAGEISQGGTQIGKIQLDQGANMFLSGSCSGPGTLGTQPIGANGETRGFVAKLSPSATALWVKEITFIRPGSGGILGQAVLPNGDVLIGGTFRENIILDATYGFVASGSLGYLACYNGSTGAIRWARTTSVGMRPVVDAASGQAYVAGEFSGTLNFDGIAPTATGTDVFIARLNAATGTGQSLVFAGGGPGNQSLALLLAQPSGQFTLQGIAQGGASFGPGPGLTLTAASPTDYVSYLLKIPVLAGTPTLYEVPAMGTTTAVALGPSGNPFVLFNTFRQPVQFGQLPVITPRGNGEVVLAHVGLVLGTRAARAAAVRLDAFPNPGPAQGSITVSCEWEQAQLTVRDVLGRRLWQGQLRQGRSTVPTHWPAGIYVLEAAWAGQRATRQLLVE